MLNCLRNISASMSANPLVREIQASRDKIVQHRYTNTNHLARSDDTLALPGVQMSSAVTKIISLWTDLPIARV